MTKLTGKEIRTAIRDRIGTLLSKHPCGASIQLLDIYDELFWGEDEFEYVDFYKQTAKGIEHPLDFMSGMAFERIFATIEAYDEQEENHNGKSSPTLDDVTFRAFMQNMLKLQDLFTREIAWRNRSNNLPPDDERELFAAMRTQLCADGAAFLRRFVASWPAQEALVERKRISKEGGNE